MTLKATINHITLNILSLTRAVVAIAAAGFDGITVWRNKLEAVGVRDAKNIISDHGLAVTGFRLAGLFTRDGRAGVAGRTDDSRRSIDIAAELGARSIVTVAGGLLPESRSLDEARAVASREDIRAMPRPRRLRRSVPHAIASFPERNEGSGARRAG